MADVPEQIDVILINGDPNPNRPDLPHYGAGETVCKPMLAAVANPLVDVLGHCTGRMVMGNRKRPESQFDAPAVFASCAEHGVAVATRHPVPVRWQPLADQPLERHRVGRHVRIVCLLEGIRHRPP